MKEKSRKVVTFIPKPIRVVDKSQEDILAERKRIRQEKLDTLLKRKKERPN
jgi:hypothetical protein